MALAVTLVAPLALATGLINPIDRGLGIIMASGLDKFLASHPDLRHGKWLVFSDQIVAAGYVSAHGINVFNTLHVIPDLAALNKLDPEGKYSAVYNSSGFLFARAEARSDDILFENIGRPGHVRLTVSPEDARLRDIGITVLAFSERPPASWVDGLKPVSSSPVDTLWLYEIP